MRAIAIIAWVISSAIGWMISFIAGVLTIKNELSIQTIKDGLSTQVPMPLWIILLSIISFFSFIFISAWFLNCISVYLKEGFSNTVFRRHLYQAKKIYILNTFAPNLDDRFDDKF